MSKPDGSHQIEKKFHFLNCIISAAESENQKESNHFTQGVWSKVYVDDKCKEKTSTLILDTPALH